MKKFFLPLVLILFSFGIAFAGSDVIKDYTLVDTQTIEASSAITSQNISLEDQKAVGYFSVQLTTVGVGSEVTLQYQLSYDNIIWVTGDTAIKTGHEPGTAIYSFPSGEPPIAKYIRFVITETAGNAVSSCTLKLCVQ